VTTVAPRLSLIPIVLALSFAGCGGSGGVRVVRIAVFPTPAGPRPVVAGVKLVRGVDVLLAAIQSDIPQTLPANPTQSCRFGPTVRVTLAGGRIRTYGPCERPPEIERMRLALLRAAHLQPPSGPVSGREWKLVLNDWYDGRVDHWHRCAAVREAVRHLPSTPPMYSTVYDDLRAYATAVC
jgi:hypothetical protein